MSTEHSKTLEYHTPPIKQLFLLFLKKAVLITIQYFIKEKSFVILKILGLIDNTGNTYYKIDRRQDKSRIQI